MSFLSIMFSAPKLVSARAFSSLEVTSNIGMAQPTYFLIGDSGECDSTKCWSPTSDQFNRIWDLIAYNLRARTEASVAAMRISNVVPQQRRASTALKCPMWTVCEFGISMFAASDASQ